MAFAGLVDDDDPDEGGSHHAAYHSDDDDACRCRLVIQTRAPTTPDLHTTTFLLLTRPVNPLSTSGLYSILQCCEATCHLEQNVCIKFAADSSSNKTRLS